MSYCTTASSSVTVAVVRLVDSGTTESIHLRMKKRMFLHERRKKTEIADGCLGCLSQSLEGDV